MASSPFPVHVAPQMTGMDAFCSRCKEHKRAEVRLDNPKDAAHAADERRGEVYLFCWDCLTDGVVQINRWQTNGWDVHWLYPWKQKRLI